MSQLTADTKLAAMVVGLIFLLVIGMIIASLIVAIDTTKLPDPPTMQYEVEQEKLQQQIKSYREASEAIRANKAGLLDLIVTKTFLPIFQALIAGTLTFIFGKGLLNLIAIYVKSRNRDPQ